MENRIFQDAISELKESIDRTIGVIDENGCIVACSEHSMIGIALAGSVDVLSVNEGSLSFLNGITFKRLEQSDELPDYAVFTMGEDELARSICSLSAILLNKVIREMRYDNASFVKEILLGNLFPEDINLRAAERNFTLVQPRAVLVIRHAESAVTKTLEELFPNRKTEFVVPADDTETVLVKTMEKNGNLSDLYKIAKNIESVISSEHKMTVLIGISTITTCAQELPLAFQEARIAIDVGKVFNAGNSIFRYDRLGIGRLIYDLPTPMCETYLREVLNRRSLDSINQDMLNTASVLFDTNLNIQETIRKLFIHPNTMAYRLERIKQLTGLDLREFDDAVTFKIALMVDTCLKNRRSNGEQ